jgi:hypothetical protein
MARRLFYRFHNLLLLVSGQQFGRAGLVASGFDKGKADRANRNSLR